MRLLSGLPRKSVTIAGVGALVMLLGLITWLLMPERHTITVTGLGEPVTFVTRKQELGAALAQHGVSLHAKDAVEPALTTDLSGRREWSVAIRPAVPVQINVAGESQSVDSSAVTVGDLLAEQQITLGQLDTVSVPLETNVTAGLEVQVTRRSEEIRTVREELPFNTVKHEDSNLRLGETQVVQAGVPGEMEIKHKVLLENGNEVSNEVVEERVVTEPVDEVVAYGTLGVVSRGGQEIRYTRELDLKATGYTAGKESNPNGNGYTYTGMKAVRGVVAVDPDVIPLYTRLYIEGYGPAIAADIGGAIQGDRIDLCFDTVAEALDWGIRPVKVYVLSD